MYKSAAIQVWHTGANMPGFYTPMPELKFLLVMCKALIV